MRARPSMILTALCALSCAVVLAACGVPAQGAGEEPVPTFSTPTTGSAGAAPVRATLLPTDCTDVLAPATMSALLGLPMDSVGVHTVLGQAAPSVGRLERVSCLYQRNSGGPSGRMAGARVDSSLVAAVPVGAGRGVPDLGMVLAAYDTPTAADSQLKTNVAAERSEARAVEELNIGTARAVLFDEQAETVLMVASGRAAATLTMRHGVVDPTQVRAVLVDMAQRTLPALVPKPVTESR